MKQAINDNETTIEIIPGKIQDVVKGEQFALPSWAIILFMIVIFIGLKNFIYMTDDRRKEK